MRMEARLPSWKRCRAAALLMTLCFASAPFAAEPPVGEDYLLHCSGCHGADGGGVAERIPSLLGVDRYLAVAVGREYLVRAPGVAQAPLSDRRLARLLNWMVGRFGNSEARPPFSEDEVGRLRADPLRDPEGERLVVLEWLATERPPGTAEAAAPAATRTTDSAADSTAPATARAIARTTDSAAPASALSAAHAAADSPAPTPAE